MARRHKRWSPTGEEIAAALREVQAMREGRVPTLGTKSAAVLAWWFDESRDAIRQALDFGGMAEDEAPALITRMRALLELAAH